MCSKILQRKIAVSFIKSTAEEKILHREKYFSQQFLKHHCTIDNTEFHHSEEVTIM